MQTGLKNFSRFSVAGTDGKVGKIQEIFFDDLCWNIRYWVVNSGTWLSKKDLLISTQTKIKPDWNSALLQTDLTLKQLRSSPDPDYDMPVFRQQETRLYDASELANYWFAPYKGSHWDHMQRSELSAPVGTNKHLRSSKEVIGYTICALENSGKLTDFIIDTEGWKIISLVVQRGTTDDSTEILLPVAAVTRISWADRTIYINLGRAIQPLQATELC
nr:hypothetical protein [uncultured Dyadobacter sp.]